MVFPRDQEKAEIVAAHDLAAQLGRAGPEIFEHAPGSLHRYLHATATGFATIYGEAQRELYRGSQCGTMVAYLCRTPGASWEDAVSAATILAGKAHSGSRSALLQAKADFSAVLHYWGVLSNDYGNKWPRATHDYVKFALRADGLLHLMRERESAGELGGAAFTSPKIFVPMGGASASVPVTIAIRQDPVPERLAPQPKKTGGRPRNPLS